MQTVKVSDIMAIIGQVAPAALQESYDNSGLLIGEPDMKVKGVMICLDVSMPVLQEAKLKKCNLIISHHPLIFKPIRRITSATPIERLVKEIIKSDMALIAVHTNLDNAFSGINRALARKFNLQHVRILEPKSDLLKKLVVFCPEKSAEKVRAALFSAGAGVIGNYDSCSFNSEGHGSFRANEQANPFVGVKNQIHFEKEVRIETIFPSFSEKAIIDSLLRTHPYEEVAFDIYPLHNKYPLAGNGVIGSFKSPVSKKKLLALIKRELSSPSLRVSDYASETLKTMAICSGSGAFLIPAAYHSGADAYLTADLKYHDFQLFDDQLLLIDAGHYETEIIANEILKEALTKKIPNFAVLSSQSAKNPVNYT